MQGFGQSAAFPWTPSLDCLLLEASTSEHKGPRGMGRRACWGQWCSSKRTWQGTKGAEAHRDWPCLPLSAEAPGLFVESTPLSHPRFLCPDPRSPEEVLSPGLYSGRVWLWTCLALAHLGASQMAQTGWCKSRPGCLGPKTAADPVPGGPASEGLASRGQHSRRRRGGNRAMGAHRAKGNP